MKYLYLIVFTILCLLVHVSCSEDTPTGAENGEGISYQLVVSADPGEAGSVTPASDEYEEGESVELTATANDDWVFTEWEGDQTGTDNPVSVTMNSDKEVTALFVKREYPLTISIDGEGTVSETVVQEKSTDYEAGTTVELTANPADGWTFVEWQGDLQGDVNPETITIEQATDVTAVFEQREYPLTINIEGEGTIAEEVVQGKTTDYESGTNVELTANPADGWTFTGWEGDLTGSDNPATITMDVAKEVTAVFERGDYPLTINIEGEGAVAEEVVQGKTTDYNEGTTVELTANPADGWVFAEWQGDLVGDVNPETITMDEAKEVTAVFEEDDGSFFLAENGVTVMCPEADIGDKATVSGTTYTKRTRDQITPENAATTCTSGITDMNRLFSSAGLFNQDISSWDVSAVTTMERMFERANSFDQDIGNWDVSAVINMSGMFISAGSFNQNINGWDVSSVTNMNAMFFRTEDFRQDIGSWDVSNVTNMDSMFELSRVNQELNIGGWDVSSVTNMNGMFDRARSFNQDIGDWDVSSVTNMNYMFSGAFNFNQNIGDWNVSNVVQMSSMFSSAASFNQDIGGWDVSNVTSMSSMFSGRSDTPMSFNQYIGDWDVSNVTTMSSMFSFSKAFNQDLSNWNVSNVTDMSSMFAANAHPFNQDIRDWDVSNVTRMIGMFHGAINFNQNIGDWDVSNVTTMSSMFRGATSFNQNIGGWDVSNVTTMNSMFREASAFNQDIGEWDVLAVRDMRFMFTEATEFNEDIGGWNLSNVTTLQSMFSNAQSFNQDIGAWNVSSVTNMTSMFEDATLFNQDLTLWCVENIDSEPRDFAGGDAILDDDNKPIWGTCPGS
jgi:uncharacterized repeat protein (TIGR02543 family)